MICIVENDRQKQRSRFKTLFSARVCCSSAQCIFQYVLLFSPDPSRLCLNAAGMPFNLHAKSGLWSLVLLQGHLCFSALWHRLFSLLLRVSWVWLAWNSTVPDGGFQNPRGRCEANDTKMVPPFINTFGSIQMTASLCFALCTKP